MRHKPSTVDQTLGLCCTGIARDAVNSQRATSRSLSPNSPKFTLFVFLSVCLSLSLSVCIYLPQSLSLSFSFFLSLSLSFPLSLSRPLFLKLLLSLSFSLSLCSLLSFFASLLSFLLSFFLFIFFCFCSLSLSLCFCFCVRMHMHACKACMLKAFLFSSTYCPSGQGPEAGVGTGAGLPDSNLDRSGMAEGLCC